MRNDSHLSGAQKSAPEVQFVLYGAGEFSGAGDAAEPTAGKRVGLLVCITVVPLTLQSLATMMGSP